VGHHLTAKCDERTPPASDIKAGAVSAQEEAGTFYVLVDIKTTTLVKINEDQRMHYIKALSTALFVLNASALAAQDFGEWTTPNGSSIVIEEDFMDERYPRYVLALRPDDAKNADGWLIFRCPQNETEVYFSSGQFDFFGVGRTPRVNVRFPSDSSANPANVDLSANGEAVFFPDPISFIAKTMTGEFVGLNGSYFSGSFRHRFTIEPQMQQAIYAMANSCEWQERLPELENIVPSDAQSSNAQTEALEMELGLLIEKFGEDAIRRALAAR
jgi:hypothetical protein